MGAMLSTFCRQMRHTACVNTGGGTANCGCPCHYDGEMAGAAEAAAELARNEAAQTDDRDPAFYYCEVAGCDPMRRFGSAHALLIHWSRMHKTELQDELTEQLTETRRRVAATAEPEEDEEVLDEFNEVLEDAEVEEVWSPLVQDALAAVAFLDGRDQNDVIHEVMDEWAGRMHNAPDVGDAIRLRAAHRASVD